MLVLRRFHVMGPFSKPSPHFILTTTMCSRFYVESSWLVWGCPVRFETRSPQPQLNPPHYTVWYQPVRLSISHKHAPKRSGICGGWEGKWGRASPPKTFEKCCCDWRYASTLNNMQGSLYLQTSQKGQVGFRCKSPNVPRTLSDILWGWKTHGYQTTMLSFPVRCSKLTWKSLNSGLRGEKGTWIIQWGKKTRRHYMDKETHVHFVSNHVL